MSFWNLPRVPEPESMEEAGEVESYSSAAAARHLNAIDNTFVEHLLRIVGPMPEAAAAARWGLDIGTGPAQIPIKILGRIPNLRIIGIDRSPTMLAQARRNALAAGVADRLVLLAGDGHSLPFPDAFFSMVLCNSMLHHARDPVALLREMSRVAAPDAAMLLRDLRRPSRLLLAWHLWRHGRHYQGLMRELFEKSVRAAYTLEELGRFLQQSKLSGLSPFRYRGAHIGIERPQAARPSGR
jgi:SAM-dependent methyltransferase